MKDQKPVDNLALFSKSLRAAGIAGIAVALLTLPLAGVHFSLGILTSSLWSFLNFALLRQMVRVLANPGRTSAQKGRAFALLLVVKFPVLYAAGYIILVSRWFPLVSLFIGLSLWIVSFLVLSARQAITTAGLFLWGLLSGLAPIALAVEGGVPELPNLVTLISRYFHDKPIAPFLHRWETPLFTWIVLGLLIGFAWLATRRRDLVPLRWQAAAELHVDSFNGFVCGIVGPMGRRFTPFLGTLFLYILISNLVGIVPLLKSPTTGFRSVPGFPVPMIPTTTIPLAISVFCYVQWTAIQHLGFLGYLDHLAGQPRNIFTLIVSPLMVVLHLLGEIFTKPLSLSFRLFGNIWSEDTVLAVLVGMGFIFLWIEFPLVWLVLILSTVQAVVFTLLSTIYIAMVLPHEEGYHEEKGVLTHA